MKIAEFFVQLGVNADTMKVRDFGRALANIPLSAAGAAAALGGASFGIMAMGRNLLDLSNSLHMFEAQTGLSVDELQRWQNAAEKFGVSAETVRASINGIAVAQHRAKWGDTGTMEAFAKLGIGEGALSKNAFEINEELAKRYKMMNPVEFTQFASQLGVSPDMTRLYALSERERNASMSGPKLNNAQREAWDDFQKEWVNLVQQLRIAFTDPITKVTPELGRIAEGLADVVVSLSPIVGLAAKGTVKGLGVVNRFIDDPVKSYGAEPHLNLLRGILETLDKKFALLSGPGGSNAPITVNQSFYGVSASEADKIGAEETSRELKKIAAQSGTGY